MTSERELGKRIPFHIEIPFTVLKNPKYGRFGRWMMFFFQPNSIHCPGDCSRISVCLPY